MVVQKVTLNQLFTNKVYNINSTTMINNYHAKHGRPFSLNLECHEKKEKLIKDILWKIQTSNNKSFSFWKLERLIKMTEKELSKLYSQLKFI